MFGDPGLPEHQWRPTDVDERAEKRAERQVATLFGLSALCTILFFVAYFEAALGGAVSFDATRFLSFQRPFSRTSVSS